MREWFIRWTGSLPLRNVMQFFDDPDVGLRAVVSRMEWKEQNISIRAIERRESPAGARPNRAGRRGDENF